MDYFDIPIVMIVYRRLDLTKQVFSRIREVRPKELYIIADGPRSESEKEAVQSVRDYMDSHIDWECNVHRNYATENYGLRYRMPSGTDWVFETADKAIFLEDDVYPSLSFFSFCREMLLRYEKDDNIMMISGTNLYAGDPSFGDYDITFSYFASIWGWATWKRAWEKYDVNIRRWPQVRKSGEIKEILTKKSYRFFETVFNDLQYHWYRTWDYQWEFAKFSNHGLGIVPRVNLIRNLGMGDPNGEHTNDSQDKIDFVTGVEVQELSMPIRCPEKMERNSEYDKMYQKGAIPKVKPVTYWKNCVRANIYERLYRLIKMMEQDENYFSNILPEEYRLSEHEMQLNPGDRFALRDAKSFRKVAIAYWMYLYLHVNVLK
ncbi:MAG: hypothetical protein ACI4DU_09735 [Lachnospiraceae bacterium]